MVTTEQYFPRGGKKPKATFNDKKKFDFLGNADRIGKRKKYRGPKIVQKQENEDYLSDRSSDSETGIKSITAEGISQKTLQEGMIILGRVMKIFDTKLIISLPGHLNGIVVASHISSAYTKLLKAFVSDEIEEMKRLHDLFHIGEYVSVKISTVTLKNKKNYSVTLSLLPQDVNGGIRFNSVKEGMLLRGAVDSIEDHGFVVDLGIQNCRTFMPRKFTCETLKLEIGQVIWCVVKKCQMSPTNSIVTVSNKLESINSTCISGEAVQNYSVSDLKPGMAVNFSVNKPLPDGAEGCILTDSVGYIHVSQIKSKLNVGHKVKARLLYTMPISKLPFFTTRKVFETYNHDVDHEANIKTGQIIEDAKVTKVSDKSVIFKFDGGIAKLALRSSDINEAKEKYPTGSQHRVRLIHYHLSDYAYLCSDEQEVLEEKYFTMSDLSVGELVQATVENVQENGISVKLGPIKGWIPQLHMSDVGLYQETNPGAKVTPSVASKKFVPGQKISARVLKINLATSSLHLTAKPSLLEPNLFTLSRFEDAKVGYRYKGLIISHLKFAVLVGFFGEVKAVVHVRHMSHEYITNIPSAFYLGQVVNCTVLSVDADQHKMEGSFIKPGEIEENVQKNKKRQHSDEDIIKNKKLKCIEETNTQIDEVINENKKKKKNKINVSTESQINVGENLLNKKSKKQKQSENITENSILDDNDKHVKKEKKIKKSKASIIDESEINNVEVVKDKRQNLKKLSDEISEEVEGNPEKSGKNKNKNKLDDSLEHPESKIKKVNTDEINSDNKTNKKKKQKSISDETNEQMKLIKEDVKKSDKTKGKIELETCDKKSKKKKDRDVEQINREKDSKIPKNKSEETILEMQVKGNNIDNGKDKKKKKRKNSISDSETQHIAKNSEDMSKLSAKINSKSAKKKKTEDKTKAEFEDVNKSDILKIEETKQKFSSVSNFWELSASTISKNISKASGAISSSDSDVEMEEEKTKKKKKKLSAAEKVDKARMEEEKLREIERELAAADSQPKSSDQFDRLLLANPNSSELWIAYMAFHLQATEIERARAIGRRALKTISFREELDKLNVWLALLNIENRFGTQESLMSTLQEALQMNDPFQVHSKMLIMYVDTGKIQELLSLVDIMVAKYRNNPQTYTSTGEALYKLDLVDKARSVMQKAISRLDNKTHIPVLIKFAHMENNHGNSERAEALFEQIIGCMPQRVDIWCVYVDMLLKSKKIDSIRVVLERAVSQKLPVKKMKTLYMKWIEVEEKLGTPEEMEKVRQMAIDFVNKVKC